MIKRFELSYSSASIQFHANFFFVTDANRENAATVHNRASDQSKVQYHGHQWVCLSVSSPKGSKLVAIWNRIVESLSRLSIIH